WSTMNEFWQTCVQKLEQVLPPQQISAWIRPLVPLAFDEDQGVLRVSAPNRFKLDWVRKNFSHQIESLASEWFSRPVTVAFELPSSTGGRSATAMPRPAAADGAAVSNSAPSPAAPAQTVAAQTAA